MSAALASSLPLNSPEGADAVFKDARAGFAPAMRMAAILNAAGVQGDKNWSTALDWLQAAAQRGEALAEGELIALCQNEELLGELTWIVRRGQAMPPDIYARLRAAVDLSQLLSPPRAVQPLREKPMIAVIDAMANQPLCGWLRMRAEPYLRPATLIGGESGQYQDAGRSNSAAGFTLANTGLPLLALRERMANLLDAHIEALEPTNVLRYEVGESFGAHYDALDQDDPDAQADIDHTGQRTTTILVYLNEDYEGGETAFPRLNAEYRCRAGQALLWMNLSADRRRDLDTLHEGRAPSKGTKWVLSQWVRDRPAN